MTEKLTDLKPRPFCGGVDLQGVYDQESETCEPTWIECRTCRTQGPIGTGAEEAGANWNRRA